ncbi:hypothetical protein OQJ18_06090 [Fluoribacter dumoffii]|uniref:Uncharacterized protein n=1 Tax=Fluoribacter dumoffii TaxID=463 RepID=A0A377G906_9GAMM|nr:hypothetical protein [Fluoribacter dumoffii]KTC89991.1 hypothetical protein Ldum_1059 [Fluoribacter dumoffii NY 23]MCW8418342.1 hypothetical protein [Fluoribacter dumoffii]MCW8453816.1 hypothetical protein [Fluoribacter dumoffii]MCW8462113.1 hypothetical protein [Fluoribacter dumoffii]MCW8482325.1 hypothetical protein [Fluoribacter dumoffii]
MSKLTEIYKELVANFKGYLSDNDQVDLLAANIELFEKIPETYLKHLFKKVSAFDLIENNESILIIADSYIYYALENKKQSELSSLLELLNTATSCYQRVINSIQSISPSVINEEHGNQLLVANFELHKIKFIKAELQLFFIEKDTKKEGQDTHQMRNKLISVLSEYNNFKRILEKSYKDPVLRRQLSIDSDTFRNIQDGIKLARSLLDSMPKPRKLKRPQLETSSVEKTNVQDSNAPKLKKKKQNIPSAASTSSSKSSKSEEEDSSHELNDLVLLSSAAVALAPMVEQSDVGVLPIELPVPVPQNSEPQPSLPMQARAVEDSQQFLHELKKWSDAYFHTKDHYSEMKRAQKTLEKIAHSLLFGANKLETESSVFKGQKFNPVIQVALQLFVLACEKGALTGGEATFNLDYFSKTYSPLLKPFVRSFLHTSPEKYIRHLQLQFISISHSNIHFRELKLSEIVDQLFEHFETVLTAEDYEKVRKCCHNCLTRAYDKLKEDTQQNSHSFQLA